MTASSIVARLASRAPDSVVLSGDGLTLTSAALVEAIERFSAVIASVGPGGRSRVGVVMGNGPRLAATCVATMALATCAPLDPRSRPDELRIAYRRLGLDAVIVDDVGGHAATLAAEADLGVFTLSSSSGGWLPDVHRRPGPGAAHVDEGVRLALVLSSSGTTSEPKLIGLTEANLLSSADAVASTLRLGPDDRCLNVMPLFHIHGLVGALLSSLVSGARVECAGGFDAFAFRRRLSESDITWSTAVPTMYQAMLLRDRAGVSAASELRFLRSSSAPLQASVWHELEDQFECPVLQAYGMTEASHQMASNPLPPDDRRVGTVGPGAGAEMAILVDGAATSRAGVAGEVVVRGSGVMPGYLAPMGANDAAWVDGWFRTGDLGQLDGDGYLTLIGRLKEIINVGGETVSPFEVEAVVLDHPGVVDAAAFALADPLRGETVGLVVVPVEGGLEPDDLRRFVAERLSRGKVPTRVVLVETIPLGHTGKVQRSRLPDLLGLT